MRLLLLVSALLGAWGTVYQKTQLVGVYNTTFSINVTGGLAVVWVQWRGTASLAGWIGLGFSSSGMNSNGDGSDIFFCLANGSVARYWATVNALDPGTLRSVPSGNCNSTSAGGVNTKFMTFTRFANATGNERAVYAPATTNILLARGGYPQTPHASEGTGCLRVPIVIAAPPTPVVPTPAPTAPTVASPVVIPGYSKGLTAVQGKVKIGWDLNGTSVRFAYEVTGATYVAIGFANDLSSKMTGDVVVAQSSGLSYHTVTYTNVPVAAAGTYFTDGSVNATGTTIQGHFTRTIAAPVAGGIALSNLSSVALMVAYGNNYPNQIGGHIGRQQLLVDLLGVPTAPTSIAPTSANQVVIVGYPMGKLYDAGRVKLAWEVSADRKEVRWAIEGPGTFSYIALGFQRDASTKMTGDAVVIQSSGLTYHTVTYAAIPVAGTGVYFTNASANFTGTARGDFTRPVISSAAGGVNLTDLTAVTVMVAYGNTFPNQIGGHNFRQQIVLNLLTGTSTATAERSPAVAPKVVAIVILGLCALIGFIFTVGLSHTPPGRWLFFRRVCQDSQFLGPRTPACFDLTWGQTILVATYFGLITLFSRLEFGQEEAPKFLRAMGWTSTLAIACASIPVNRHSVLLYFFGLSFERAILIHRILGRTAVLIVLMHFVAVLLEPSFQPFSLTRPLIPPYMIDMNLGFWAFMCMLVMFTTSLPMIRRKFFELFYYTHHLFIVVWILSILHNQTLVHQLTLIVPVALWGLDRLIRFYRGRVRQRELVSATIIGDALRLEFKGDVATCTTAESGSYAFINVPKVSLFQWHPFSISSRSGSPNFTFHIKNMGPGTFTGALHEFFASKPTGARVNIDGPYGRSAVRFEEYQSVLLIAGGVGVTPMAAILDDLYEKCKGGKKPAKLEHVTFCWSVQAKETIAWMEELIKKIQANPTPVTGVTFNVQVFVTRSSEVSPMYQAGRPKLPAIFETAARPKDGAGKAWQVGVLACGPEAMVVECQKQAMVLGHDFHKEIFAF